MPHSTRKKKNAQHPTPKKAHSNSRRKMYIMVGIVIAIVAGVAGFYSYYSTQKTLSTTTSDLTTGSTTNVTNASLVYAVLKTSQGTIEVELFKSLTPSTVSNFIALANSGFYNNLVWHRIVKGFVIQTGDPTTKNAQGAPCNWGSGSSPTSVPFEYVPSLHNYEGYLAMASTGAKVGGTSQFYINLVDNSKNGLDGNYAVFGEVIKGMNVVDAIGSLPTTSCSGGGSPPSNPSQAMLNSVTVYYQNPP